MVGNNDLTLLVGVEWDSASDQAVVQHADDLSQRLAQVTGNNTPGTVGQTAQRNARFVDQFGQPFIPGDPNRLNNIPIFNGTSYLQEEKILGDRINQVTGTMSGQQSSASAGGGVAATLQENARVTAEMEAMYQEGATKSADANKKLDKSNQQVSASFSQVSRAARLGADALNIVSTAALAGGVAIEGTIWGLAAKYVKDSATATAQTQAWKTAENDLASAGMKAGQVFEQAVLPDLQKAAEIANQAADFVKAHPEVAQAAVVIGGALMTIGTIGKVAASGIRIYADLEYLAAVLSERQTAAVQLTASQIMAGAADKQLAAALDSGASGGFRLLGKGTLLGGLGEGGIIGAIGGWLATALPAIVAGAVEAVSLGTGAWLGQQVGNFALSQGNPDYQGKSFSDQMSASWLTFRQLVATDIGMFGQLEANLHITSIQTAASVFDLTKKILGLGDASNQPRTLADSASQGQIVQDYINMLDTIQKAEKSSAEQVLKTKRDEAKQEEKLADNNAKAIDKINQNYANTLANIVSSSAQANKVAEENFASQRAITLRDAGLKILDAEQALQTRLADLRRSHEDKLWDLAAKRDALGIVRENHAYDQQRQKDIRDTNAQIAKDRRDLAIKLQDEANAFNRSQEQKHAQEALQLQRAAKQHDQQLQDQQKTYDDQLQAQRDSEQQKLDDLQIALRRQEDAARTSFIRQVRMLDAALLGEEKVMVKFHDFMLQQATDFINKAKGSLAGLPQVDMNGLPIKDSGGYATRGVYGLAWNGVPEYVLSGSATAMAEKMAGGQLTDQKLFAMMSGGAGRSIVYNDSRIFSAEVSSLTRQQIKQDTLDILKEMLQ